ncbi:hypothetical protein [Paraliomyxa miuraensis]|uniref:hypothetical protein n=1 Tax=Paraliomyxa miuraensis TaxID=376150 RepID=UPI0022591429|nr:hypothetical protein [Paraliomyxa miuraensis]MCX4246178.1 hypothetical protein [Paraliomyxa miuraensis]
MEDRETLAFGFVDDVFVVIHLGDRVDEREWQACMQDLTHSAHTSRVLLVARDLMPDVGQRYDLGALQEKRSLKVALLSDATACARVATALKWSGIAADGFRLDDLDGVLVFLGRPSLRARLSSALGPYLDRSWQHDPSLYAPVAVERVADTFT